jgi:hypothetical protein
MINLLFTYLSDEILAINLTMFQPNASHHLLAYS